jgi:hypothetical protein
MVNFCCEVGVYTKYVLNIIFFFLSGSAAQRWLWHVRSRGLILTHDDTPQSVGLQNE